MHFITEEDEEEKEEKNKNHNGIKEPSYIDSYSIFFPFNFYYNNSVYIFLFLLPFTGNVLVEMFV